MWLADEKKFLRVLLVVVIAVFIILSVLYAARTVPWQRPDEFAHFSYIKFLQKFHRVPVYLTPYDFWEAHQPPLYYLLNLPVVVIFSSQSITAQMLAVRIFNLIFAVLNIWVLYKIFSLIFSRVTDDRLKKYYTAISTVLAAFWPMYVYISSGINNDNLANLLGSVIILFLLKLPEYFSTIKKLKTVKYLLCIALLLSASLLTKTGLYPLAAILFLATVYYFVRAWKKDSQRKLSVLLLYLLFFCLIVIILGAWFYIRNKIIVGDFFGWRYFNLMYAYQKGNIFYLPTFIIWLKKLISSTLGIFGYMEIYIKPMIAYRVFYGVIAVGFIGNIIFFIRNRNRKLMKVVLLYTLFLVVFISVFIYSTQAFQPQGRYLFPGLAAIIFFLVLGIFAHLKNEKLLLAITIFLLISAPLYLWINLGHIRAAEIKINSQQDVDKNNMLGRYWHAENARITKNNDAFTVTTNEKEFPRVLCFGDSRIEVHKNIKLEFTAKTSNVKTLKIIPAFMADNGFRPKYGTRINLTTDDQPHQYAVDITGDFLSKPDIVIGLEFTLVNYEHTVNTIEFTKINLY